METFPYTEQLSRVVCYREPNSYFSQQGKFGYISQTVMHVLFEVFPTCSIQEGHDVRGPAYLQGSFMFQRLQ